LLLCKLAHTSDPPSWPRLYAGRTHRPAGGVPARAAGGGSGPAGAHRPNEGGQL